MFQFFKIAELQTAEVLNDYLKIHTNTDAFLIIVIILSGKLKNINHMKNKNHSQGYYPSNERYSLGIFSFRL